MNNQYSVPTGTSNLPAAVPLGEPLLWIVECAVTGAFETRKKHVADKWASKPGVFVTPYFSKITAVSHPE